MTEPTQSTDRQSRRIPSCTGCQQELPLRLTLRGEKSLAWMCAACGAAFSALLDKSAATELHRNVRVSGKLFLQGHSQTVPQGMVSFLAELAKHADGSNQKEQERRAVAIRAAVIPVDEHLSPIDDVFSAMMLSISQTGLSLLHTRAVSHRFLLIEFDDQQRTQVVLEVIRCRHVGRFYDIAGRFVTRLGTMQSSDKS